MANKKRRKRKSKYVALPSKSIAPVETQEQMRAKFPKELVNAFIKVKKTNFENEKAYKKLIKLEKKYLGKKKADDRLEISKLIVLLSKATMSLFEKKKGPKSNGKTKKKKEKEN